MDITLRKINRAEVLRYLGYGDNAPDALVAAQLDEAETIVRRLAKPRVLYRLFDLEPAGETLRVRGTALDLAGEAILAHLAGADQCVLLVATLGMAVEREIFRLQVVDLALATVVDVTASAAIEQVCDQVQEELAEMTASKGRFLTTRFSPGYGDMPLSLQQPFCSVLDAGKIGVTVSKFYLLTPRKSVTAVFGICREPVSAPLKACALCAIADTCSLRKAGTSCGKFD
ncbi:MAG: methionine synthase [Oscillospiraceae bacterium]|nr:methionine synthase [Oscillospiraceae bacterium]